MLNAVQTDRKRTLLNVIQKEVCVLVFPPVGVEEQGDIASVRWTRVDKVCDEWKAKRLEPAMRLLAVRGRDSSFWVIFREGREKLLVPRSRGFDQPEGPSPRLELVGTRPSGSGVVRMGTVRSVNRTLARCG